MLSNGLLLLIRIIRPQRIVIRLLSASNMQFTDSSLLGQTKSFLFALLVDHSSCRELVRR